MSDDLIKAEVRSVRTLKRAISEYTEQLRAVAARARSETAAVDRRAQEAVEARRSQLRRRESELRAAQAALAHCTENCGGLQHAVNVAARVQAEAQQALEQARKAAQITAGMHSDLIEVLHTVDAQINEHSSVAASALADLDARLSQLPHFDLGHAARSVAVGMVGAAEIAGAGMNFGRLAANTASAFGAESSVADQSVAELREHEAEHEATYVGEKLYNLPEGFESDGRKD